MESLINFLLNNIKLSLSDSKESKVSDGVTVIGVMMNYGSFFLSV